MTNSQHSSGTDRAILLALCELALRGELSLDQYHAAIPESFPDGFLQEIAEDIEDGVEHAPGRWLRGGVDITRWIDSHEYLTLYLDRLLLRSTCGNRELAEVRQRVLADLPLSRRTIKRAVAGI